MNTAAPYSINGDEPHLVGKRCTGFVLQHFHEGQRITDQVNVAYLRFAEQWYRLYFECATIFWRESEAPATPQNSGFAYGLLLNDLSGVVTIVGQAVRAVAYAGAESGDVHATITFENGETLEFVHCCEADSTRPVG